MTAENSNDDAKSKLKIKATAGAWWKSAPDSDEQVKIQQPAPENQSSAPQKKKVAPTPTVKRNVESVILSVDDSKAESVVTTPVRKPRRKASTKTVQQKDEVIASDMTETIPIMPIVQDAEGNEPAVSNKPARKRPARKRSPKEPQQLGVDQLGENTVHLEAVPIETQGEPTSGETGTTEINPEKIVRKRPPRKRRTTQKKVVEGGLGEPAGEQNVAGDQVSSANVGVDAGGGEPPVEGNENSETGAAELTRTRPPRKRSRRNRKKKAGTQDVEGTASEEKRDQDDYADSDDDDSAVAHLERAQRGGSNSEDEDGDILVDAEKPKTVRLLINAEEPEECRLALLEDGRLESIHVSTVARLQTKSNIYKAKIVAIEPNLQAAFVDYGTPKNGFLPFSEIHPEYYKDDISESAREHIEHGRLKRLKIEDVMERGQEMLVQVVKEEVGKKGANMTTYLSLPGRCVVLMPGSDSAGISRKISGEERRSQLRDIMQSLGIPEGIGWIVRTASVDITRDALSRDVTYLLKLWEDVRAKGQLIEDVGQVYEDHRSVMRFLREHFDPSIQEILVDDQKAMEQVNEFIEMLPANQQNVKVRLHRGSRPIFNQFSVEDQIESIYQPQVSLPSGGSIVIDPTEALVAIDVNSGSTSKGKNFDESIYQANMEAAVELARQLRLRDLGGLIVVDFIDMRNKKHIRDVERQVKVAMKRDKAKVDFSRISKFGLMQISRQKLGSPIEAGAYRVCEHCKGRGTVRAIETHALFYLRRIQTGASRKPVVKVECRLPLDVASYLLNNKRHELHEMEDKYDVEIVIIADGTLKPAENEIIFHRQEKEENSLI